MPKRTVVNRISRLAPAAMAPPGAGPAGGCASVFECADGTRGWLDPAEPWSEFYEAIIEDVSRAELPASILVDEPTQRIIDVDVPLVAKVRSVRRLDSGDLRIRLQPSCVAHVLTSGHADFAHLSKLLSDARGHDTTVAVRAADNTHQILDVAEIPQVPFDLQSATIAATEPIRSGTLTTIAREQAEEVFDDMLGRRCSPMSNDCIPFTFPDDGCHARAHRMCELMRRDHRVLAGKVWLFGDLRARTRNHAQCRVEWLYHVAPVVNVRTNGSIEPMVIDPSLFAGPVTISGWKRIQGDPNAELKFSAASIWDQPPGENIIRDADFSRTPRDLVRYRNLLRRRIRDIGPPPYCRSR